MNTDLLIHVDSGDVATIQLALANISNYFSALHEPPNVYLVANGPAVTQFKKNCPHAETLSRLHKAGVRFEVCNNALIQFNIRPDDVHPACTIMPSGMLELVRLQREGCAYVKP